MNTEQFAFWFYGMASTMTTLPTAKQWALICTQLEIAVEVDSALGIVEFGDEEEDSDLPLGALRGH